MATEVTYNGDGSNKTFSITFPFIKSDDVKVQVGGSTLSASDYSITGTVVTTDTAPASGTGNVKLYRVTPIDYAVHDFSAGSTIRAKNLNDNQKQVLYGIEEAKLVTVTSGGITTGAKNDVLVNSDSDWVIQTDAIEQSMLADDSVGTDQYINDSIEHVHLKNDCIDADNIVDNAIKTEHYADNSIEPAFLKTDCVEEAKIKDAAVTANKIAAGAVTLDKIASDSVDEDNLKISNAGTNGDCLTKQSGNTGGLTWATVGGPLRKMGHMSTTTYKSFSNETWEDTGLELTFTPSLSSSLIILDARPVMFLSAENGGAYGTAEFRFELGDAGSALDSQTYMIHSGFADGGTVDYAAARWTLPVVFTHFYTNSNTNAKTFKLQGWKRTNAGLAINPDGTLIGNSTAKSHFTVSEYKI